jgi:asparagine synthetase B (glutamine-hydrolysing)
MCGIYASVSKTDRHIPSPELKSLLCNRGPDHAGDENLKTIAEDGSEISLSFFSTVLALRGGHITKQPLHDASGSILCWNGEAWQINQETVQGNDGEHILGLLTASVSSISKEDSIHHVLSVLRSISGPFAFVYFDKIHHIVYFGRDCLGRRSLLINEDAAGIQLSSLADSTNPAWREVEADGIYMLDISMGCVSLSKPTNFPMYKFWWSADMETVSSPPKLGDIC